MSKIIRTDSSNPDFIELVKLLDRYLKNKDGDEHDFFAQFNKIADIKNVMVAYLDGFAVGCGAIKIYEEGVAEVKRMFVRPEFRGKGIASNILKSLEDWANELGFKTLILETGKTQEAAIGFI